MESIWNLMAPLWGSEELYGPLWSLMELWWCVLLGMFLMDNKARLGRTERGQGPDSAIGEVNTSLVVSPGTTGGTGVTCVVGWAHWYVAGLRGRPRSGFGWCYGWFTTATSRLYTR